MLVWDYGFIRNSGDDALVCVSILKLYPFRVLFACAVPKKGVDELTIKKVSKFLVDMGLTHFAYRSDKEPGVVALPQAVCQETGKQGEHVGPTDQVEAPTTQSIFDLSPAGIPEAEKPAVEVQVPRAEGEAVVGYPSILTQVSLPPTARPKPP